MRNLWNELRSAVANADVCDAAMRELAMDAADDDAPRLVCLACGAGNHAGCSRPPRTTPAPFAVCECVCHDGKEAHQ